MIEEEEEEEEEYIEACAIRSQWLIQTGIVDSTPWYDVGLNGTGEVLSLSDTGLDIGNCYFWDESGGGSSLVKDGSIDLTQRKVIQYIPYQTSTSTNADDVKYGHGTHVAAIMAGKRSTDGITNNNNKVKGEGDGIAFGAKIAIMDIADSDGILRPPSASYTDRLFRTGSPYSKIHLIPWGNPNTVFYGSRSRALDRYLYEHDDILVIVSAGNQGKFGTIQDPANFKNGLTVGSTHSYPPDFDDDDGDKKGSDYVSSFSSLGPAGGVVGDLRIKPDVLAPGQYVLSAGARPDVWGSCDDGMPRPPDGGKGGLVYKGERGTSLAAATVAGAAALIRQYLSDGFYPTGIRTTTTTTSTTFTNPSSALIKAILINGAQPVRGIDNTAFITPSRPYDYIQGFGRISLLDSLYVEGVSTVQAKLWDRLNVTQQQDDLEEDDGGGGLMMVGRNWTESIIIDTSNGCINDVLSVTLVWTDPEASTIACGDCLKNDLDLMIIDRLTGTSYHPNGIGSDDDDDDNRQRDDVNNVERIRIQDPQVISNGRIFDIQVNVSLLHQDYGPKAALVATGCFGGMPSKLDLSERVFDGGGGNNDKDNLWDVTVMFIVMSVMGCFICLCLVVCVVQKWILDVRRWKDKDLYEQRRPKKMFRRYEKRIV